MKCYILQDSNMYVDVCSLVIFSMQFSMQWGSRKGTHYRGVPIQGVKANWNGNAFIGQAPVTFLLQFINSC